MVGVAKWKDEWVAHVLECKRTGNMNNQEIAESLQRTFPQTLKNFNVGGVKYVLQNWKDSIVQNDQVLSGGVKKQTSKKATKPSAGKEKALKNAVDKIPSQIITASSHGRGGQPKVVGGGNNEIRFDGTRPMNMPASSAPSSARHNLAVTGNASILLGPQTSLESSMNTVGYGYPLAPTAGVSADNFFTLDDDVQIFAGQNMLRSSTNHQAMDPYPMGNHISNQHYMQYNPYTHLQTGQKRSELSNQMNGYMNEQTQNVRGGFSDLARVGLVPTNQNIPGGSAQRNSYNQLYKQTGSQGPGQAGQASYRLPNADTPSVHQSFGGNLGAGSAGVNHGLLAPASLHLSGSNVYDLTGLLNPQSWDMFGTQNTQTMLGNTNAVVGMTYSNTDLSTAKRSSAASDWSSTGQSIQQRSPSKSCQNPDDFDYNEGEKSSLNDYSFGIPGTHHASSVPISQSESNFQAGEKRKRQDEALGPVPMSAAANERSNSDLEVQPWKRLKQGDAGGMLVGSSGEQDQDSQAAPRFWVQHATPDGSNADRNAHRQTAQLSTASPTPISQSMLQPIQAPTVPVKPARTITLKNVGTAEYGYNDKFLQWLQHDQNGNRIFDRQSLSQKHRELIQRLTNKQGGLLTPDQQKCAKFYQAKLNRMPASLQTEHGSTNPHPQPASERVQSSQPGGMANSGMPNSGIPYAKQEEQFRLLQDKIPMSNSVGARAPISQLSQQSASRPAGNIDINGYAPGQPQHSSTSLGGEPRLQVTPYKSEANKSTSQAARITGHKFDGPPLSHPTPNMSRPATATSQQSGKSNDDSPVTGMSSRPETLNRSISAPKMTQTMRNGANAMHNTGVYPQYMSGRPHTASSVSSTLTFPSSVDTILQTGTPQLASISTKKSTSRHDLNAGTSQPQCSEITKVPITHQAQGHTMNTLTDALLDSIDTSKTAVPSSAKRPYQSPYLADADSTSRNTREQIDEHDQPLYQTANTAVAGGTRAPGQISGTKAPSQVSRSEACSGQDSLTPSIFPSTGNENSRSQISLYNGVPFETGNVNLVEVLNPIFNEHFTFPSENDGWQVLLDHINQKHLLMKGNNNIVFLNPIFNGGVTWPTVSNQPTSSRGSRSTAPKPRRKTQPKKAVSPPSASGTSTTTKAPLDSNSQHTVSTSTVSAPPHPPLRPGEKLPVTASTSNLSTTAQSTSWQPVPAPPHPPLRPGEKLPVAASVPNLSTTAQSASWKPVPPPPHPPLRPGETPRPPTSTTHVPTAPQAPPPVSAQNKKPESHDLKSDTSMHEVGIVESQKEFPFSDLYDIDCDDDDLFGDGEVFYQGNSDDQISSPSSSSNTEKQSIELHTSINADPAVSSSSQVPVSTITQQLGKDSVLDKTQPANQETLAPTALISILGDTQQASKVEQAVYPTKSRYVHVDDPKPIEEDILTSENQAEWRARHPIYQPPNPFANAKKPSSPLLAEPTREASPEPSRAPTPQPTPASTTKPAKFMWDCYEDWASES